jgi:hypothetical protein
VVYEVPFVRVASGAQLKIMRANGQQLSCWTPTFRLLPSAKMKMVKSTSLISLLAMEQFIASPKLLILLQQEEEELVAEEAAAVVSFQASPIGFILKNSFILKINKN